MFTSAVPMLCTDDIGRMLGFYRDLLGFVETYRFPAEGDASFVALELDGCGLGIGTYDGNEQLHGRPVSRERDGRPFELCVYATDVDAAVARLREGGVPVVHEPADQPWGERMAYVADPEGTLIMIAAHAEATPG